MTNEIKLLLEAAEERKDFADALGLTGSMDYLKFYQTEIIPEFGPKLRHLAAVIALKRKIRKSMQYKPSKRTYLKTENDGYLYKQWLEAKTAEDAEAEFSAHYMPYFDRGYDCTGQLFTQMYRIFNVNGKYLLYHWVAEDC